MTGPRAGDDGLTARRDPHDAAVAAIGDAIDAIPALVPLPAPFAGDLADEGALRRSPSPAGPRQQPEQAEAELGRQGAKATGRRGAHMQIHGKTRLARPGFWFTGELRRLISDTSRL